MGLFNRKKPTSTIEIPTLKHEHVWKDMPWYIESYKEIRNKYAQYLKPRAVVEDMINDIQYVKDTEHLEMVELLLNSLHQGVGSSSKNKATIKEHKGPVIEVEK